MFTVIECLDPIAGLAHATALAQEHVPEAYREIDLHVLLPESGKWSVSELKRIGTEHLATVPVGETKAVVLGQFDDVSAVASDVLLKKLEEPLPGVSVWLSTLSRKHVSTTLQSRTNAITQAKPRTAQEIAAAAGENTDPAWLAVLRSSVPLWEVASDPAVAQVFAEDFLKNPDARIGFMAASTIEDSLKSQMKSKLPSGYVKQACRTWLARRLTAATTAFPHQIPAILQADEMLKVNINPKQALTFAAI